ncbi:MAG: deoxyguanosinetriphosphate triphosphohydrolase [Actinomycetota bacterium]
MTTIREQTERIEAQILSQHAQLSAASKGRDRAEPSDALRTCYQRDRDRLLHSKAFRRLKHKTQVFFSPIGDHFRVRMTHTLETAQIARTIARALRLNEDLTEAVSLGHDLGHTPFGHIGEAALSNLLGRPFKHAEQSLRIVELLETRSSDGPHASERGLNLTWETREGILGHTWTQPEPSTLEGKVVRYADRIAYLNHDLDDAIRAGILEKHDVPASVTKVLGATRSERISSMVMAVVTASRETIEMTAPEKQAMLELRDFLFERLYLAEITLAGRAGAERVIEDLFAYYKANPEELPVEYRAIPGDDETRVADYISGMTDRFAVMKHQELR